MYQSPGGTGDNISVTSELEACYSCSNICSEFPEQQTMFLHVFSFKAKGISYNIGIYIFLCVVPVAPFPGLTFFSQMMHFPLLPPYLGSRFEQLKMEVRKGSMVNVNPTNTRPPNDTPEIRKYKKRFNSEILCAALWGKNGFSASVLTRKTYFDSPYV